MKNYRVKKVQTNKLVDRLTYSPEKHKQKYTRELRKKLQQKASQVTKTKPVSKTLKFGSHNINGLDLESSWAVSELLKTRDFDVSKDDLISIDSLRLSDQNLFLSFGRGNQNSV